MEHAIPWLQATYALQEKKNMQAIFFKIRQNMGIVQRD